MPDIDVLERPKIDVVDKMREQLDIPLPPMFMVIYHNDDVTPFEFVMESLTDFFKYQELEALELTNKIHLEGHAAVASDLSHELASHLRDLVTDRAVRAGFPLQVEVRAQ